MTPSTLLALLTSHAKLATAVAATAAVTASGGMAVASAVTPDNPHAAAGLAQAAAAQAATHPEAADAPAADVTLPECPADVKNHGAYVSSVAKTTREEGAAPNAHGKLVSAAAQSDCGKPAGGDDADTDEPEGAGGPADQANDHARNHPTGKPDTAGKPDNAGKPDGVETPDDAGPSTD